SEVLTPYLLILNNSPFLNTILIFLRTILPMFNFLPKDTVFYDLFEKLVQHVVASAKQLNQLVGQFPRIEASLQLIRNEEHAADDWAHQALDRLDRTFS